MGGAGNLEYKFIIPRYILEESARKAYVFLNTLIPVIRPGVPRRRSSAAQALEIELPRFFSGQH